MKVGIIIPTRGDRPQFLKNCLRQLENQTLKPSIIEVIDYVPESNDCDITQRYRRGYDALRKKEIDVIAFIEDDEYYCPDYLKIVTDEWIKAGRPELLGTSYTIYYHIKLNAWFTFLHNTRSAAMSTLIVPDLNFRWCADHEPYFDIHIWREIKTGKIFTPQKHICLGMKHGIGKTGGQFHIDRFHRYENKDPDRNFIRQIMEPESFKFFTSL